MPSGPCGGCQRMTNSTTSNWWHTPDRKPTHCYAAHDGEKWVEGCALDKALPFEREFALSLIKRDSPKRLKSGGVSLTAEQEIKLKDLMDERLKRPDFRHTPGLSFHTSWARERGRPRAASTKRECIDAVVKAVVGDCIVPSALLVNWLNGRIPDWREAIGITNKTETYDNGQGQQAPGRTLPGSP